MGLPKYDFAQHTIQDPIHGSIRLGPIERGIIDHSLFQRLHGLRQNSLLYLVFPSANHTRFDHSLGVMWIASQFFDAIIHNQQKICSAGQARKSYQKAYRVDDQKMRQIFNNLDQDPYYRIILRAAALFHDIGHGPFSHLFDKFFPSLNEVKPLLTTPQYKHIYTGLSGIEKTMGPEPISHEIFSCIIATSVLNDIAKTLKVHGIIIDDAVKDICAAIVARVRPSKRSTKHTYNVATLLHDIISSEIDADRMDYLLRDSHMCGVTYGHYDQDRILKSMCAYATLKDHSIRAAIRYSGVGALEDLLIARYQMHAQIYGHKTNRACSTMLDAIRERLKKVQWKWYSESKTIEHLLEKFTRLDDKAFVNILLDEKIDGDVGKVKEIAEKLFIQRKLVKRVFEERVPCTNEDLQNKEEHTQTRVRQYMKRLQKVGIWAREDTFENKGPKIKSSNYPLKVLRKHYAKGYYEVHEAKEFSTVAHYLPEVEKTYRIYSRESHLRKAKELMPR